MNNTDYSKLSFKNKYLLQSHNKAGCYHCEKIFFTKNIIEWVDDGETALCPHCHIDSVIPFEEKNFQELLKILFEKKFKIF